MLEIKPHMGYIEAMDKNSKLKEKYNFDISEIAKRLKIVRTTLNLTIEKMHQTTGFSKSLISEAENGVKKPSSIYLFALLEKFNVNINYIFLGEGDMFLNDGAGTNNFLGKRDPDNLKELLYYMKNVDIVKYNVLSFFCEYKINNKELIRSSLEQAGLIETAKPEFGGDN
jgi:transcriptional regulator with XRE-family HTH domain